MADKPETGGMGSARPPPGSASRPPIRHRVADDKLQALDALCAAIKARIGIGLTLARDNPGRTPPTWSLKDRTRRRVVTFGLVDRTFFWTWDEGTSNHYAKDAPTMTGVILDELRRFGHLV